MSQVLCGYFENMIYLQELVLCISSEWCPRLHARLGLLGRGVSPCHEQEMGTQYIGKFPSLQKMRIYCLSDCVKWNQETSDYFIQFSSY